METITDDPELAQDILQLVHQRLRQERQEHQRLLKLRLTSEAPLLVDSTVIHAENEVLRDELVSLRLRISAALDSEDTKRHSSATEERRTSADQDQSDQNARFLALQSKLIKYKEKSRVLKAEKAELREMLSTLKANLSQEEDSLQDSQVFVSATRKKLEENQRHLARITTNLFRPTSFLSEAADNSNLPQRQSLAHFLQCRPFSKVPKVILRQIDPIDLLVLPKGALWSEDGISRALYITYSHRYNPSAGGGAGQWESDGVADGIIQDMDRDRELFFQSQNQWYYYGTYRCVGYSPQLEEGAEASKEWQAAVGQASASTAVRKQYVAPVVFQFAQSLRAEAHAPLRPLRCLGLERVGFQQELYDLLLSSKEAVTSANPHKSGVKNARTPNSKKKSKGGKKGRRK